MVKTYLRLDLYNLSAVHGKINTALVKLNDEVDVEAHENIHDLLCSFNDSDYCELYLVTQIGTIFEESLTCCFRRVKLKGQKDYQWLTCEEEKF